MCAGAAEGRIVGNGHGMSGAKYAVVLDDDDEGIDNIDRLPNPIVIAVDIDAQQADLAAESIVLEQCVDVVSVDECRDSLEVMPPIEIALLYASDVFLAAVHDESMPIVVYKKEPRIGLAVVIHSEFDERVPVRLDIQRVDQVLDDAIVAELREYLELRVAQALHWPTLLTGDEQLRR